MSSNLWLDTCTVLGVSAQLLICLLILRKRQLDQWQGLFALCLFRSLRSIFLACVRQRYSLYFWCYWDSAIVVDMLQIYLMADILRALPGRKAVSAGARYFFGFLALFFAIGAWTASMQTPSARYIQLLSTVTVLSRSIDLAWAVFVVAIVASVSILGLGWRIQPAQVASGYFIDMIFRVASSLIYTDARPSFRALANETSSVVAMAVCFYWLHTLAFPQIEEQPSQGQIATIRRFIEQTLPALQSPEGKDHV